MLRESSLSILSIDLSLELAAKFAYLPAIYYSSYIEGQWVGGKPRIKGFLGSGWMHVVVSFSRAVVQHYVMFIVIVCFDFIVVPGVSYMFFRTAFCIRCTSFLFLLFGVVFRHRPATSGQVVVSSIAFDSIRVVAFLKL